MCVDHLQRGIEIRSFLLPSHLGSILTDSNDFAGVDEEIHHPVEVCASVDDTAAANQEAHACNPLTPQSGPGSKTTMGTVPLTTPILQSGGTAAPCGVRRHWLPGQESASMDLPPPLGRSQHRD